MSVDAALLTKDFEQVEKYKNDSLVHPYLSLLTGDFILEKGKQLGKSGFELTVPSLLMAQGAKDGVCR